MLGLFDGNELNQIYAFKTLHSFALGLINVFIPVFIAQQGFLMEQVFLFMAVDVGTFMLAAVPVGRLLSEVGDRRGLMFSYLFFVPAFLMLELVSLSLALVLSVGVLIGIGNALFWIPINTGFTAGSSSESRSSDYGWLMGLAAFAGAIAPLLGGLILSYFSFSLLVSVTLVFVLVSAIPLFYSRQREPESFSVGDVSSLRNLELDAMFFFAGISAFTIFFVLPLFIYYVVGGALNVGIAAALAGLSSALFSVVVGKIGDRVERFHLIMAGTAGTAVVLAAVPRISTALTAFAVSVVMGLLYRIYHIPLFSIVADIGERGNKLGFYSVREVFLGMGRFVMLSLTVAVTVLYGPEAGFETAFYISAGAILVTGYLGRRVERYAEKLG